MNQLIRLAANALPGEKKYVLFAGAGVSKDAGIPSAWDLMLETAKYFYLNEHPEKEPKEITFTEIEDWFVQSKYAKMEYAEVIGGMKQTSSEQQSFLDEYLGKSKPGDAHRAIAEMARRGILRAIVTTNFDHCLEKSLREKGLEVQVIASDEILETTEPLIHCKKVRVYKPHGTLGEGALRNTPKDLESLSPLMEDGLIRLLSEHGVIIIGYSGRDAGILKVLSARKNTYYPMFWVNPEPPSDEAQKIIDNEHVVYLPCKGAGAFLNDLITFQDRIRALAPSGSSGGPSIAELKAALSGSEPAVPLYQDFLKGVYQDLEQIKPDFSRFDNYDEVIYNQVEIGENISYRFIEGALLATRYDNAEVLKSIYNYFGEFLNFYDVPREFVGISRKTDFDGYKYLIHEMFLGFVAALIREEKWATLSDLLKYELFLGESRGESFKKYTSLNEYLVSLDQDRNDRLGDRRISVSTDILKSRFVNGKLSGLLRFRDIIDADFFLFQYSVHNFNEIKGFTKKIWNPKATIYLHYEAPNYLKRSESKEYFSKVYGALGYTTPEEFIDDLQRCREEFGRYLGDHSVDNPIYFVDVEKLGSKL